MAKALLNITQSGLKNWLIQNISALFMFIYMLGLTGYFIMHPVLNYEDWKALFSHNFMRVTSLLFLFFMIIHTRLGLWMIATDYLKNTVVRLIFLIIGSLILVGSFLWAVLIMWGA